MDAESKSCDVEELTDEDAKMEAEPSIAESIFAECAIAWLEQNALRVLNAQFEEARKTKKPPVRRQQPIAPPEPDYKPTWWCTTCRVRHDAGRLCPTPLKSHCLPRLHDIDPKHNGL